MSGVYFALVGDRLKVGQSSNVPQRLTQIKSDAKSAVSLLGVVPLDLKSDRLHLERRACDALVRFRISGIEWYRACDESVAVAQGIIMRSSLITRQQRDKPSSSPLALTWKAAHRLLSDGVQRSTIEIRDSIGFSRSGTVVNLHEMERAGIVQQDDQDRWFMPTEAQS